MSRANVSGWVQGDPITPAQINAIDVGQGRSVDGTNGGVYAPSSTIQIAGQGVKLTGTGNLGKVQLSSRSITRVQRATPMIVSGFFDSNYGSLRDAGTAGVFEIPICVPHGAIVTSVTVRVQGAAGHGALPATKPTLSLVEMDDSNNATVIATQADLSGSVVAYEAVHSITKSGLTWTIDNSLTRPMLHMAGESGANSTADFSYYMTKVTFTTTYMDDGAA